MTEEFDDIILSELNDEELVEQMHEDLYDGLAEEIAEVIETFFYDVGILDKPSDLTIANDSTESIPQKIFVEKNSVLNNNFKICPQCSNQTLKVENGCDLCQQCGYSKCDK